MKIKEHDIVVVTKTDDMTGLKEGQLGHVVHIYPSGWMEIEVDITVTKVITVSADWIKPFES